MGYKDSIKADAMGGHIEACAAGSLTVEQYCHKHDIKKHSYYYWYKRLQEQPEVKTFVPLTLSDGQGAGIVVNFPNGVIISFSGNISASVLKDLACCI
ncbi:MAG: hypothetical protein BGN92_02875 [Sphingobacteriales bacterium 41-5]|nr:MAG: hypothetical protein BGN92_02875 [Sphingobacteriales bacterium 41-5]